MRIQRHPPTFDGQAGMSVLEVLIAMSALLIALGGFLQSMVTSTRLHQSNVDSTIAVEVLRAKIEELASVPFDEVYRRFNEDGADDPEGANTAPGNEFAVSSLDPSLEVVDGVTGQIIFPTLGGVLSETPDNEFEGMVRDVNLNGRTTDADVSADYGVLPVRVRLTWRGAGTARREWALSTILIER